jgi:hypothetical protein
MTDVDTAAAVQTTWIDTRAMDWERFPGLDVARVKVLHEAQDGIPAIMIVWLPPGDLGIELPHRHQHVTVHENSFVIGGDLPHAEFADPDSDDHEVVLFREGYFMDRRAGSIHGNDFIFSDAGCTILCWASGTGNWLHEPGAETETLEVPFHGRFAPKQWSDSRSPQLGSGVVLDREGALILSTRDMAWEPLGTLEGARQRILVRDGEGEPTARIVFLPPGEEPVDALPTSDGDWEFAYLIEGEIPVGDTVVKAGGFMRRPAGGADGLTPSAASVTGAVLLQFRIGANTFPSAPDEDA